MKPNDKMNRKFPAGWDEKRVQKVIAHYESMTDEERLADIENAAIADALRRIAGAIKKFNQTHQSKLLLDPSPEEGSMEEIIEMFGHHKFCLLNWCGQDADGPFNEYYHVKITAQLPVEDHPFRPVLGVISKSLRPSGEFPSWKKKLLKVLRACEEGVKLEVKKKKDKIIITGVSTTIYARSVDAESLSDALIRLDRSIHSLRESLGRQKSLP